MGFGLRSVIKMRLPLELDKRSWVRHRVIGAGFKDSDPGPLSICKTFICGVKENRPSREFWVIHSGTAKSKDVFL